MEVSTIIPIATITILISLILLPLTIFLSVAIFSIKKSQEDKPVELSSKETILLKGIKLHSVYKFKHIVFEEFYEQFNEDELYKRKSILMAFYALYGAKYSVEDTKNIILNDCIHLCYKLGFNPFLEINNYNNILQACIGQLSITPIGTIDPTDNRYIKKIEYCS